MDTRRQGIERREVVELYVRYDCAKKPRPLPSFDSWDWSHADTIDYELRRHCLKPGILAGYLRWDLVALSIEDLRACAVENRIFPGRFRVLELAEQSGFVSKWKPDRPNVWYEGLCMGQPLGEDAALILRPAVFSERPANWYIEDGSGRALGVLANSALFEAVHPVAFGYLGRTADLRSTFMKRHFAELLGNEDAV